MITYILLTVLFIVLSVYYYLRVVTKPRNYPPGPKWYPVFGCSSIMRKMAEKYGSQWKGLSMMAKEFSTEILGLKLGADLTIVVFGQNNVRQVFMGSEFEGRPDSFFLKLRCFGKKCGITSADGALWREHRKFTVKELKHVGFCKTEMESAIQREAQSIIEYLQNNNGQSIEPRLILGPSVMNILWHYVAGEVIEKDRLQKILDLLKRRSAAFSMAGGVLNQFPWTRFIFPELSGFKLIQKINSQLKDIIDDAINRHISKEVAGSDFIYSFLNEMKHNKETFTYDQLRVICLDLLIAGSQTTSNLLEFALLAVIRDVNLQNKIFEDINKNIGKSTPTWNDTHKLNYTMSFLLEVQRFYTITPFAGPRKVLWDTTIDGYQIPKGTTVLLSVGDIHSNPEIWKDPGKFIPERFLDDAGLLKIPENNFYPFGLGRRRCPGESLAKSFTFIVFVSIMQHFEIMPRNGTLPSDEPIVGLLAAPKIYSAQFVSRS